jgi:hypothetical protein
MTTRLPALTSSARLPAAKPDLAPLFDDAVSLPTGGFNKDRAIKCLAIFISKMRYKLRAEWAAKFSRHWAETTIIRKLREGRLDLAREAIEEATAGDEIFHNALCFVAGEMDSRPEPPGLSLVWDYGKLEMELGTRKRRAGRPGHDNWVRDAEFTVIIWYICRKLGVPATRNRNARRADKIPSGVSILVAALGRNGINLPEQTVQEHVWNGPRGRLVREELERM